jgi:hypothetical protein
MQYGRRTLHTAAAGTRTLRAAPERFVPRKDDRFCHFFLFICLQNTVPRKDERD